MERLFCISLFKSLSDIMSLNKELLIEMDSVVGDGDLGLTMSDGFKAAYESVNGTLEEDLGKLIYQAGKAISVAVPSTMGTLMASGFMNAGKILRGKKALLLADLVALFRAFEEGVANRGKAKVGEKTFLDGLDPAVLAMDQILAEGGDLIALAEAAKDAALKGYENTAGMLACHGRAAIRGEDSRFLKDPGAYVAKLMMEAFSQSVRS